MIAREQLQEEEQIYQVYKELPEEEKRQVFIYISALKDRRRYMEDRSSDQ